MRGFIKKFITILLTLLSVCSFAKNPLLNKSLGTIDDTKRAISTNEDWPLKDLIVIKAKLNSSNRRAAFIISSSNCGRSQCKSYLVEEGKVIGVFSARASILKSESNSYLDISTKHFFGDQKKEEITQKYFFNGQFYESEKLP